MWSMFLVLRLVVPVCPFLLRACAQLLTWQFDSVLGTRLGVQIVPASGSSSELSSHQMAIRSHPGVQKMPANGISSELSAHQMAPPGAFAHSRARLCPRASSLSFFSLVSPLRPLGLGLLGRCDPRVFFFTTLRTQVRPAIEFVSGKEGLRPGIAAFVSWYCCLRVLVFFEFVYWLFLKFARAAGPSGGRGEMAMAVASSARIAFLRGAVCASTLYTRCCPFVPCTATGH